MPTKKQKKSERNDLPTFLPIGPDRQKWKNLFVLDSFYFTQKQEAEKKSKIN